MLGAPEQWGAKGPLQSLRNRGALGERWDGGSLQGCLGSLPCRGTWLEAGAARPVAVPGPSASFCNELSTLHARVNTNEALKMKASPHTMELGHRILWRLLH